MGSRDIILQRRARFVAASLAAAGFMTTPAARAEDAGDDASIDGSSGDLSMRRDDDPAEPQACLCACTVPETDFSATPPVAALAAAVVLASRLRKRSR